jgi:DNA-binding LytR/AlgR family response regulator
MRLAVCDDEEYASDQLVGMLRKCPRSSTADIDVFDDFSLLRNRISDGVQYQAVFMDIELKKEKTGIDFAAEICRIDPYVPVVFVTGYAEFSQDIFLKEINLGGFLIKPADQSKIDALAEVLAWKWKESERRVLDVISSRKALKIPIRHILYIESSLHQCLIHTDRETIKCSEKLGDISRRVPKNFRLCHKSYLVNMDRVYKLEMNRVCLDSGEMLPVSRAQNAGFTEDFFRYIGEKK